MEVPLRIPVADFWARNKESLPRRKKQQKNSEAKALHSTGTNQSTSKITGEGMCFLGPVIVFTLPIK